MVNDGRCHCRGCDQARVQGAEDVAKRIRKLHSNVNGYCRVCSDCGYVCETQEYPCETIKALDGVNGSLKDVQTVVQGKQ